MITRKVKIITETMSNTNTPVLFPYEPDELWEKFREIVHSEIQKLIKAAPQTVEYELPGMTQKPLYKAQEVCAMFQISRQTLHLWSKQGILKPYRIKSRVFFLRSDLDALMNKPI